MWGLFFRYVLPALVLTGAVSFGVHKYNDGVREKAVASALVKERAITAPLLNDFAHKFKRLDAQFKGLESNIIETRRQAKIDADAALAKEKDRADTATLNWRNQIAANKKISTERDSLVADRAKLRAERVPELTRPIAASNDSCASDKPLRDYADGLGILLARCQQSAAKLRQRAGAAVDRVGEAEATSKALSVGE
jgi:hypothetical protein